MLHGLLCDGHPALEAALSLLAASATIRRTTMIGRRQTDEQTNKGVAGSLNQTLCEPFTETLECTAHQADANQEHIKQECCRQNLQDGYEFCLHIVPLIAFARVYEHCMKAL